MPDPAPAVSVVIPTFDRMPLLREAVESVLRQTMADWELVIVDDGSSDGTRAYLDTLDDPRVRTVLRRHSGSPALTRNAGIAEARGEWVAFLDSDDWWRPEKLEVQLGALRICPGHDWSYTATEVFRGPGETSLTAPHVWPSGWIQEGLLRYEVAAAMPTLMVRRSLLEELGGFDPALPQREDYDLELRLASRSRVVGIARPLTVVRDHPGRTTSGFRPAELFRYNAMVAEKAQRSATSGKVRRLSRRQRADHLLGMANALSLEGRHREAALAALRGGALAGTSARRWRGVVASLLRTAARAATSHGPRA